MYMYMYVYIHVYVHVYVCIYIYIYIYIDIMGVVNQTSLCTPVVGVRRATHPRDSPVRLGLEQFNSTTKLIGENPNRS